MTTTSGPRRAAALTDTGSVRARNEDSAYAGHWLYAVADGLGGHVAGDVASATVIRTLRQWDTANAAADPLVALATAIHAANEQLLAAVTRDPELRGMGTTLTAILIDSTGAEAVVANIGDSRAYLLRDRQLHPLAEDHTLGRLVAETRTSAATAARLVRYLDGRLDRSPDLTLRTIRPGDRYLLCSDGLTCVVGEDAIAGILSGTGDANEAADLLVQLAGEAGSPDNVTVIVIDTGAANAATAPATIGAAASASRVPLNSN
jgi:PPM family protein phosphatase